MCSALATRGLAHDAAHPHEPDPEEIALGSLADAELAFAKTALERGWNAALIEHMGTDGVVLEDAPMHARDLAPEPRAAKTRCNVQPAQLTVSRAFDLGCATGAYAITRSDAGDAVRHGVYLSMWRRERGGWRIVLTTRIDTPAQVDFVVLGPAPRPGFRGNPAPSAERARLVEIESRARRLKDSEVPRRSDVRIYRAGFMPQIGPAGIVRTSEGASTARDAARFVYVSRSADLAATAGAVDARAGAWYVHVWLRGSNGRWQMAYDVETAPRRPPE